MTRATLLCVHAHPDDEALFTAGIEAHYARRGVRQVLITCTVGQLGFDSDGVGCGDARHNPERVAAERVAELETSCEILGIDRLEVLGYRDSGMAGWAENQAPDAFVQQPVEVVAARIASVIEEERPQVVVTYADDGFYGHPDHIHAHRATMAAVAATEGIVEKVYFVAMPKTAIDGFVTLAQESGMELPEWLDGELIFGTDDDRVQTIIDCGDVVRLKHQALAAHASQVDNADLVGMEDDLFDAVFSVEMFVRGFDVTDAPLPETDLFVGTTAEAP
jgi:LmbE family N-acetylglucosaminyl deacetylase